MQLHVRINADNISPDVDPNDLANIIENFIRGQVNMPVSTTIYDQDGKDFANPILTHNTMRQIKRAE